jgi:hypothetical protein
MKFWNRSAAAGAAAIVAVTLAGVPAHAKRGSDDAKARSSLAATAAAPGAEGECRLKFGGSGARFEVRVGDLAANAEHDLLVNDAQWASFTTDKKGRARLRFSSKARGRKDLPIPGDPRGATLRISNGAEDVLSGVCSGEGEAEGSTSRLRVRLAPTALAPSGSEAKADFEVRKDGEKRFEVELVRATPGDYAVFVDGVERGTVTVGSLGRGELEWGDDDGGPPLDFDPRGKVIDVSTGAGIVWSGTLAGSIPGVTACTLSETETALVPTAAAGAGSGDTKLRIREDCRRDFSVEIEDVPVGDYDLVVDGVPRGTIAAVDAAGQVKGEIEFTSKTGESELFLDFEPVGAAIEVKQGDVVFFTLAQGGPGTGGGGGGGGGCAGAPLEIDLPLLAANGSGAQGDVRFRIRDDCAEDFKVEIEDVSDGGYDLRVGGVTRATITVSGGEGEVEFRDPVEPGKILLDFDPRGQAVEVFDGGTLILQRAFPSGS